MCKSIVLLLFTFIQLICLSQKNPKQLLSKVTGKLLVIHPEGAFIQSDTTIDSEDLFWFKTGDSLLFIKEYVNWFQVNANVEDSDHSIKGFVQKSEVIKFSDFQLTNSILNIRNSSSKEDEDTLNLFKVRIELISKDEFLLYLKTAETSINFSKDIHKKNGEFIIPLNQGKIVYKDSLQEGGGYEYEYEGEIPVINAYIISEICHHCEEISYRLISKNSGTNLGLDVEYLPVYSSTFKRLISLGNLMVDSEDDKLSKSIDSHAEMSIYVDDNFEESASYLSFPMWKLMDELPEFWGVDGSYYFACTSSFVNNANKDKLVQYARMKLSVKN